MSSAASVSLDDLKNKYGQMRAQKASLQAQLESLRALDEAHESVRSSLDAENDELGKELRSIEEKAILYRSTGWTCFEIDLDVGRRARAARQAELDGTTRSSNENLGLGIRLDTFWRGRFYEPYYLVFARPSQLLETPQLTSTTAGDVGELSKSDDLRLIRHTLPHFVPLEKLVEKYLPSILGGSPSGGEASTPKDRDAGGLLMLGQLSDLPGVQAFLSDLHLHLQAYVSRRQQAFALQRLQLPSPSSDEQEAPALDALGTEAFDLVKITWYVPSPNQSALATPTADRGEIADAETALSQHSRKRTVNRDESAKNLEVIIQYSVLRSDRLVDDTRPRSLTTNTDDATSKESSSLDGTRLQYGEIRVQMVEYPAEAEVRERRSVGVSRAETRALEPKVTRREDLEARFSQEVDGESLDLDEAFQELARQVWNESDPVSPMPLLKDLVRTLRQTLSAQMRQHIDPCVYQGQTPNFRQLASTYPETFGRYVRDDGGYEAKIDFQDAAAVRSLAQTLLKHDFGVHAVFSETNLCPTIPNRLSYVALISDVLRWSLPTWNILRELSSSSTDGSRASNRDPSVRGLDIGTGASAIYPILGSACFPSWTFVGTDIDIGSLEYASNHIIKHGANQNIAERIHLRLCAAEEDLIPSISILPQSQNPTFHFSMCNPPFYTSPQDMQRSASLKAESPNAVCHGTSSEMVVEGGEVAFISRMMHQSASLSDTNRVLWYTSMVGKLSSLPTLVTVLKTLNVDNWGMYELKISGGKTRRWVIMWSLSGLHLTHRLTRNVNNLAVQRSQPATTERTLTLRPGPSVTHKEVLEKAESFIGSLPHCRHYDVPKLDSTREPGGREIVFWSQTWTRRARRSAEQTAFDATAKPILMVRISVSDRGEDGGLAVTLHWTFGRQAVLFESFAMSLFDSLRTSPALTI